MEARFSEPDLGHLVRRIFDMNGRLRSGASVVANARRPEVPAVLKDSVRQLREALGDSAESPTYIETAHRRGYRFIGKCSDPASAGNAETGKHFSNLRREAGVLPSSLATVVLGREAELAKLCSWLDQALAGERQILFVTGEAGVGKTTMVHALLEHAGRVPGLAIARGQCLEHFGAGEAYMPVLDGFSRLGRSQDGTRMVALLRQHAPAWLAQIPSLVPPDQREAVQAHAVGATRERMLREMAEAVETFTAETPLILVLEDLHWSDYSTLDLISYLGGVAIRRG